MRFEILQEHLVKVLSIVSPALGKKSDPLITSNVMLTVAGDTLTVTATNLAVTISANTKAKVHDEGQCLVAGRDFLSQVEALNPAIPIEIQREGEAVIIKAGDARTRMPLMNEADFPRKPSLLAEPVCMVLAGDLRWAIQRGVYTTLAEKYDAGRPALAGIEIFLSSKGLAIFSHDMIMTGITTLSAQTAGSTPDNFGANVRAEGISPLAAALAKSDYKAEVFIHRSKNDRHIGFSLGGVDYIASTQESRVPVSVAPQIYQTRDNATVHVEVERRPLLSAMRLAKLTDPTVHLRITENDVKLVSISGGGTRHTNSLGKCLADGKLEIALSSELLIGALALMDCNSVTLWFSAWNAPFSVTDTKQEIPWVFGMAPLAIKLTAEKPTRTQKDSH